MSSIFNIIEGILFFFNKKKFFLTSNLYHKNHFYAKKLYFYALSKFMINNY